MNTIVVAQFHPTSTRPEAHPHAGRLASDGRQSHFPAGARCWLLITACLAVLFLTASHSFAENRFAVISVSNETSANLTISYRWGTGPWKQRFVGPGAKDWFSWKYASPNANQSPDFFIKFDSDSGPSKYTEEKKLHGFAAPEQNYDLGHKYAFRYDGPSKNYIEIWDVSGPGVSNRPTAPRGVRID